jgi:hypothetical protein
MSVTIDSTNPRTMADNIRKLDDAVAAAASELPEVEASDEGKVLTVDSEGSWAAEDLPPYPVGNLDYSTTEQDTGVKWIDGKNIYRKVFSYTTPSTGVTSEEVGTISDLDKVLIIQNMNYTNINNYIDQQASTYLYVSSTGSVMSYVGSAAAFLNIPGTAIIYYTKTEASTELNASPDRELNAEPEQEAEPVLKKETRKKTTTNKKED